MFSLSFFCVVFVGTLLQGLVALPWLTVLFFQRHQVLDVVPRNARTASGSVSHWRTAGLIRLGVFVVFASIVPFLRTQGFSSLESLGMTYAGILQVQLTLDLIIFTIWIMLKVWPKGGAVAQAAFREGVRQPMFWLIVVFAFTALTFAPIFPYFTFGEDYVMTKEIGYDTIMLATVVFGVLAATLFVTDEIEGRTAITLMSKPVSRRQFLLGKFVGIMLAAALMFGILGFYFQGSLIFKSWFDKMDPPSTPVWVDSMLMSFGLPGDASEFVRGGGLWTQHMLDTLPGLVLSFCQVMVLVAFAVSFATRVPMVVNLIGILAIYFLAHLSPVLVQIGSVAQLHPEDSTASQVLGSTVLNFVAQVFDTLLPALEFFRVSPRLVSDSPPDAGPYALYLATVFFYGLLYSAIILLFGLILFEDRDLA